MNNTFRHYGYYTGFFLLVLCLGACSKMNDSYHKFWEHGEKIYPASPDSLRAYSGKNRVELHWLVLGDPSLTKAVIYWNNETDSLVVPITKMTGNLSDTLKVVLDHLAEGAYSFDIYTFDTFGNRSVVANVVGKAYGDSYQHSLLTRIVNNASFVDDTLHIQWGDPADQSSTGVELDYTDAEGVSRSRVIPQGADTTVIADYDLSTGRYFTYRTLFLPDSLAIDTFATAYDSVRVLGPRADLEKTGWTVTASSYDNRNGRTDRTPEMAIDEKTSTAWINLVGSTDYPHTLTVDMGATQDELYGFSFYFTSRAETPSAINVYTSDDGENWQLMGLFTIKNQTGWQYLDFSEPQSFRYFKVKADASYGSPNIVIYEAGVFTR